MIIWERLELVILAVERLNRYGQEVYMTPWAYKDVIESYTWYGYEGKPANVHVFSAAEEVELFVNGKSKKKKQEKPMVSL